MAIGPALAVGAGPDGSRSGDPALRRRWRQARPSPSAGAGLGGAEPGDEAQARHPSDPVGRVCRGQPGRLPLQPLLRPLPGLGGAPAGDHAPDPPGRRQAVRRLCRRHRAGDRRPADGRGAGGACVRGGDGRIEPQLRPRQLDRGASRLDRRPRPGLRLLRRGGPPARARQLQGRPRLSRRYRGSLLLRALSTRPGRRRSPRVGASAEALDVTAACLRAASAPGGSRSRRGSCGGSRQWRGGCRAGR